jgi:hypothetical protein
MWFSFSSAEMLSWSVGAPNNTPKIWLLINNRIYAHSCEAGISRARCLEIWRLLRAFSFSQRATGRAFYVSRGSPLSLSQKDTSPSFRSSALMTQSPLKSHAGDRALVKHCSCSHSRGCPRPPTASIHLQHVPSPGHTTLSSRAGLLPQPGLY